MSYKQDWEPGHVIGFTVVITLCIVFVGFMGTVFIRWANTPYYPPQPTEMEISAKACADKGGVLKTKWVDINDYSKEIIDACEGAK